jgi:hypothetical protein
MVLTLIPAIIFLVIMLMFFVIAFRNFQEKFYNVSLKPELITNINPQSGTVEVSDPFKGTPIVEIIALETRRFPYVVENVKNWYSTQPLTPSILATDIGKLCTENSACK